jgi:hypothetical protein
MKIQNISIQKRIIHPIKLIAGILVLESFFLSLNAQSKKDLQLQVDSVNVLVKVLEEKNRSLESDLKNLQTNLLNVTTTLNLVSKSNTDIDTQLKSQSAQIQKLIFQNDSLLKVFSVSGESKTVVNPSTSSNEKSSSYSEVTFCLEKLSEADLPENLGYTVFSKTNPTLDDSYPELFWIYKKSSKTRYLCYKCHDKLFQLAETSNKVIDNGYNGQIEKYDETTNFENDNYKIVIKSAPANGLSTLWDSEILVTEKNTNKLLLKANYSGIVDSFSF